MSSRKRLKLFAFALLVLGIGRLLLGPPGLPDDFFGWQKKIGVLLIQLFFIFHCVLWGRLLLNFPYFKNTTHSQALPNSLDNIAKLCLSLPIGAAFLAILGVVLGCASVIGERFAPVYLFILFIPHFFKPELFPKIRLDFDRFFSIYFQKAIIFTLFLGLFAFILDGFELKSNGDVFNYHLTATRLWFDVGQIKVVQDYLATHQTGLWDSFHLWGVELLSAAQGRGLVAVQHFAQWSQIICAFGGSIGVLFFLFRFLGLSTSFALIGTLVGMSVHEINPSYAKNDWGSTFWILSGVALIEWSKVRSSLSLWGGFVLGAGISSKWTTLFFVLPFGFTQLFLVPFRQLLIVAVGTLLGSLPILIRNLVQVGNPIFPAFNRIFESPFEVRSFQNDLNLFQSEHFMISFEKTKILFAQIFSDLPYLWIAIIAIILCLTKLRRSNSSLIAIFLASVFGLLLFIGAMTERIPARLAGPLLVFFAASSFLIFILFFDLLKPKKLLGSRVSQFILFMILAACSHFPLYAFKKSLHYKPSNEKLVDFSGGVYKKWIRDHVPLGSTLVHSDNEFYYLLGYPMRIFPDLIEFQDGNKDFVDHSSEPDWLFHELLKAKPDYLVLGMQDLRLKNLAYWIKARSPSAVIFNQNNETLIIDIKKTEI